MPKIQNRFTQVMKKLSLLGHNQADLIDCSDVIPVPKTLTKAATFPAGKSQADVEIVVGLIVYCRILVTHNSRTVQCSCYTLPRSLQRPRLVPLALNRSLHS